MIGKFLKLVMGNKKQRLLKKLEPVVAEINRLFADLSNLSDEALRQYTDKFREQIREVRRPLLEEIAELREEYRKVEREADKDAIGNDIDAAEKDLEQATEAVLEEILPSAFAVVKETCRRLVGKQWDVRGIPTEWDMVPYDVQLMGAITLHRGMIAEMATGEGKTLVATMPIYLNALVGEGVHVITVNDYLAARDSEWMGEIFRFLGLSVSCIQNDMGSPERQQAYAADITYGTNSEFGFDYLRDNMAIFPNQLVQRGHYYCIIDEVDSVLIDEARTPLIISGPVENAKHNYDEVKPLVSRLHQLQKRKLTEFLEEAESGMQDDAISEDAAYCLLHVKRGAPKNKRLMKWFQNAKIKKAVNDLEIRLRQEKVLHQVDDKLYFSIDEQQNIVELSDQGQEIFAKTDPQLFVMSNLDEEIQTIKENAALSIQEKIEQEKAIIQKFTQKSEKIHNIQQLLKAFSLFEKDVDYIVQDDKVMIVDQFTGRLMAGRRFSDGLHQALEAKENVTIAQATQTIATITLQNYFRMYKKLAGMTGTAETEEAEFEEIYKLPVAVIPTNKPIVRQDWQDLIFRSKREKYNAIIDEISAMHQKGRPVLVGTISVEVSELLSRMLRTRKIPHNVLNAKQHQREAEVVAHAGEKGSITIATNMAGRGTDIKLGKGVVDSACEHDGDECYCGLYVLGTERHESRRIDRQLRGRSGRQGDPGASKFYLSLEDDLMRLFGSDRISGLVGQLGIEEGEAITHPWMTKAIERAQRRVEAQNFEIRKHLLQYDDVMNQQREVVYSYRRNCLKGENLKNEFLEMIDDMIQFRLKEFTQDSKYMEDWNWEALMFWLNHQLMLPYQKTDFALDDMDFDRAEAQIRDWCLQHYQKLEASSPVQENGTPMIRVFERILLLQTVDHYWKEHLYSLDYIKSGINLRAYGQKDPLIEYKREATNLFYEMVDKIRVECAERLLSQRINLQQEKAPAPQPMRAVHQSVNSFQGSNSEPQPTAKGAPVHVEKEPGRNDPCPCGSGKKYKHCCGKNA